MDDYIETVTENTESDDVRNRFTAYVQTALRNRKARYLSGDKSRVQMESSELPGDFIISEEACFSVAETEILLSALEKIQERERKIVYQRAVQEKSFVEIATALEMKYSSVTMVYYRALRKLRSLMQEDENRFC